MKNTSTESQDRTLKYKLFWGLFFSQKTIHSGFLFAVGMSAQNEGEFNVWSILHDIEWKDPLLIGIIVFHIAVTLMALMTRNHGNFQLILFLTLLLLVYFSENLNEIASNHWRLLSHQQYFDSKGMFISLIFSVPLLLNCMVMMASWLWESSKLMVQLKSAQLKQKMRKSAEEEEIQSDVKKEKTS